ncbi:hypothetical protein [Thiocapsa bogorovii]|uniref:hypothetical protein n=1 Tax=Thiocapsa bogorovii TaxID=521689 RepID=UPI001E5FD042|nr:hypothetical protein [Thiocapsa bogorovii]UHD15976.1 hypothetical protein LT988_22430 [Thiocapsa bogorovii]
MTNSIPHPQGEPETTAAVPHAGPVAVDTFGGRVHVEWDAQASVRRSLGKLDEADGVAWSQNHLDACVAPVLGVPWILDTDLTVKPHHGHQEGAVKGDNPHKPGRPSHSVAVRAGLPHAQGWSDRERMGADELVYRGVVRTPVYAPAERAPLDGDWTGLAAEHFATASDVYRLTGELPVYADLGETADGRAKGEVESAARLARMLGEDAIALEPHQWRSLASYLRQCRIERIWRPWARRCSAGLPEDAPLVGAGVGRFLVPELARRLGRGHVDWLTLIARAADPASAPTPEGADAGGCAPAVALALLPLSESGDALA